MEPLEPIISDEIDAVFGNRHYNLASVMTEFTFSLKGKLSSTLAVEATSNFDKEFANMKAALDMALDNQTPCEMIQLLKRLFIGLSEYLELRAVWNDKIRWGEALLRQLLRCNPESEDAVLLNNIGLLNNLATAYDAIGDYKTALPFYEYIIHTLGDHYPSITKIYSNIAVTLWRLDRIDEALVYAERALTNERQTGESDAIAQSLMNISQMYYHRWEMEKSLTLAREAREMAQAGNNPYLQANIMAQVAMHMVGTLQFDEAVPVYEEALKLLAQVGHTLELARTRFNYALLCRILKRETDAKSLAQTALKTFEDYQVDVDATKARQFIQNLQKND